MPHKFNADRRDKIAKQKFQVTNWPAYNESLRQRGDLTVWVSDDANHIPVRVESPITVGSVKVDMMGYRNLRYPLTSLRHLRSN